MPFDENIAKYIANALSPAKNILSVDINESERRALVKVPEDQLSLAIGRSGQNVRLAAKLTDWNIDIDGADESGVEQAAEATQSDTGTDKPAKNINLEDEIIAAAEAAPDEASEEVAEPADGKERNPVNEDAQTDEIVADKASDQAASDTVHGD